MLQFAILIVPPSIPDALKSKPETVLSNDGDLQKALRA